MIVIKMSNTLHILKCPFKYDRRFFSTTAVIYGTTDHDFNNFIYYGRGSKEFRKRQEERVDPDIPYYDWGVRKVGFKRGNRFVTIPEKIPDIIVPDLTDFPLKPYVSYRAPSVIQGEFTPNDLFKAVYSRKIVVDYRLGKLDDEGNSLEPSEEEKLTPEEALRKARQTGADLFTQDRTTREEAWKQKAEKRQKFKV